jgi:hypothetical protein
MPNGRPENIGIQMLQRIAAMPFLTHGSYRIRYELAALEQRHADIRKLWTEAFEGVGISISRGK